MTDHIGLNLLNKLRKRDTMQALSSIISLFRKEFNKFNNTRERMLDYIKSYDIMITLKSHFWRRKL